MISQRNSNDEKTSGGLIETTTKNKTEKAATTKTTKKPSRKSRKNLCAWDGRI